MIVFVIFFTRESSFLSGHQQSLLVQILSAKCQVCSIENKAGRGLCWSSSLIVIRICSQMICLVWVVSTNFPTVWGWKGSEQLCNLKLAKHWHRVHMAHRKLGNLWNSIVLFSRPGKSWNFLVSHGKSWKIMITNGKLKMSFYQKQSKKFAGQRTLICSN